MKQDNALRRQMIIDAAEIATKLDFDEGCAAEREFFIECMASPQSGGLRHAFFAERGVAKVPGIERDTPVRELNTMAVIGAGTMGAGIAYAGLASGFEVTLLDNSEEGLARGMASDQVDQVGHLAEVELLEVEVALATHAYIIPPRTS